MQEAGMDKWAGVQAQGLQIWVQRAALACGLMLMLAPGAAQAQFFGGQFGGHRGSRFSYAPPPEDDYLRPEGPRMLPPRAVFRMLADEGYRVLAPVLPRGRVYLADVADSESGQRERLVIDAYSGDIVESYPMGPQFAPPGRVPGGHAPLAGIYPPPSDWRNPPQPAIRVPQNQARLAPHAAEGDDPLVIPGIGAAKPAPRAHLPRKPKAVVARHTPVAPARTGVLPKPVPVEAQPLAPPAAAAPAAAAPVAVTPVAPPLPSAPPLEAAPPVAAPVEVTAAPAVNDVPPAPLDEATPGGKPRPPVNDVPVAPLE